MITSWRSTNGVRDTHLAGHPYNAPIYDMHIEHSENVIALQGGPKK